MTLCHLQVLCPFGHKPARTAPIPALDSNCIYFMELCSDIKSKILVLCPKKYTSLDAAKVLMFPHPTYRRAAMLGTPAWFAQGRHRPL